MAANADRSFQHPRSQNAIGFRAAFNVSDERQRADIARSCQNFPIQSSAAACLQITGLHLAEYGADIRLPIHDADLLNVPDDPTAIVEARLQIEAATEAATNQTWYIWQGLKLPTSS